MKRILLLIFLVVSNTAFAEKYIIDAFGSAWIMDKPDKTSNTIEEIPDNTIVEIDADTLTIVKTDKWGWRWIKFPLDDGRTGYINADDIQKYDPEKLEAKMRKKAGIKNDFGALVSLKWCFIITFLLAIYCYIVTRDHSNANGKEHIKKPVVFILMNIMLILTYFSHNVKLLVDNDWTGGWINGYFMVFINSIIMAFVLYVEYTAFLDMSWGIAHKAMKQDNYHKFKPALLFWIPLLCFIPGFLFLAFGLLPLLLVLVVGVLCYLIKQIWLFRPRFDLGIMVVILAMFSFVVSAMLLKTFILSLLVGIFALCVLMSIPKALGVTLSGAAKGSFEQSEDNVPAVTEEQEEYDYEIKSGGKYGSDVKAKDVGFGIMKDEDGGKWKKKADGTVEKYD